MIKKILFVLGIIAFAIIPLNLTAATANIKISNSSNSLQTGTTLTTKVTVSSTDKMSSVDFYLSYSDNLELVSGDAHKVDDSVLGKTSATYTYKFRALKPGAAKIYIDSKTLLDINGLPISTTVNSTSLNISGTAVSNTTSSAKKLSSNNLLSSIKVNGFDLSPKFDKNVTNYTIDIDKDIDSLNIEAKAEDSKSTVEGTGKLGVEVGENIFEIKCTAENGKSKSYFITVNLEDPDKIEVKIGNKVYTVVKDENILKEMAPENYEFSSVTIKKQKIPALKGTITKLTLVALRDNDDNYYLFQYDKKKNKYYKYSVINFNSHSLYVMPAPFTPNNTTKTKIKKDKINFTAYELKKEDNKYYIYAMDVDTGKKSWYLYDKKNDKISLVQEDLKKENHTDIYIICGIILVFLVAGLIFLILKIKNRKFK